MFRWEPWVRSYLIAYECIESMEFKTIKSAGGELEVNLTVFDKGLTDGGNATGRRLPLARIVRPKRAVFEEQVQRVLAWSELREERRSEILVQIDNVYCFWNSVIPIMSDRLRHTRELLDAAVQMAMFIEMRFKHELACWRPADLSAQVQPMISTPGHGSLPSGHCTQSYVVLAVLKSLLRSGTDSDEHVSIDRQLERLAQRISTNRVVAGVHFPVDNLAGRALGQALGEYFVYLCHQGKIDPKDRSSKLWNFACFDGERVDGLVEFDPQGQPLIKATPEAGHSFYDFDDPIAVARNMDPVRARSLGIASAADLRHVARNLARNPGRTTQPPIQAPMLQELYEKAAAECDASGISFA